MAAISTKPYLIRAIYEWCTDSGYRPYIAVVVDEQTLVPREFVRNGEIVLNVSAAATNRLQISNDLVEFEARFGGVPRSVSIPINNVSAIFAQETGHGMAFEVPKALALVPGSDASGEDAPGAGTDDADGGAGSEQAGEGATPVRGLRMADADSGDRSATGGPNPAARGRPRLSAVPSSRRRPESGTRPDAGGDQGGNGVGEGSGAADAAHGNGQARKRRGKDLPGISARQEGASDEHEPVRGRSKRRSAKGSGDPVPGDAKPPSATSADEGPEKAGSDEPPRGGAGGRPARRSKRDEPEAGQTQPGASGAGPVGDPGTARKAPARRTPVREAEGDEPPTPPSGPPRLRRVK